MSRSALWSQTSSSLIVPNEKNGAVRLGLSVLPDVDTEQFGYEHLAILVQLEGEEPGSIPMQGRYTREEEYLVFAPYFPWERGMTYLVRTKSADREGEYVYQSFQVGEKQAVEKAAVTGIYPTADELPENLLRFYFYFQTPMKQGQALTHIQLMDAAGKVDDRAFMEFKQELWSPDGKRLTILFDPGRIKRGVSTNLELGPALLEGKRYHLTISAAWQDVYGQTLSVETQKAFVVGKAYRQSINVQQWAIRPPKANSHDALSLQADRIMDHALVQSMIQIKDAENNLIAGHWKVSEGEQLIQFVPAQKWQKGSYRIVLDSRMEDVAGNNLQNLLDHKETSEANRSEPHLFIPFEI